MVILCLLVSVEEDAPRRKSATILCLMDRTSQIVAIWRSQGFDDFEAPTALFASLNFQRDSPKPSARQQTYLNHCHRQIQIMQDRR
jgi:hypothetical protein